MSVVIEQRGRRLAAGVADGWRPAPPRLAAGAADSSAAAPERPGLCAAAGHAGDAAGWAG